MKNFYVGALIALAAAANAAAADAPSDGTYGGTLACEAAISNPSEVAFSAPVNIKVEGSRATWVRETPALREIISAPLANGKVSLDGFGGSVSAATKQAFWDWKLTANLVYTPEGFNGHAQLHSKDGRDVLRNCSFASSPSDAAATAAGSPSQAPARLVANTAPVALNSKIGNLAVVDREDELRKKEEALARRERALKEREQSFAPQAVVVVQPASKEANPPTSRLAEQAKVNEQNSPAAAGDTARLAESAARALAGVAVQGASVAAAGQGSRASVPLAMLQAVQQQMGANSRPSDVALPIPSGMTADARQPSVASVPWPTKETLLAATRKGEFVRVTNITYYGDAQFAPLLRSVSHVLVTEYNVPPLPPAAQGCSFQYSENVLAFVRAINGRHISTLNNQPPEFYNPSRDTGPSPEALVRRVTDAAACDLDIVGMRRAHPYKQALIQLMGEYGQATKDYVDVERRRRQVAFQRQEDQALAEQNRQREAQARHEAIARAAAQKRIDAERARIEADEQRRQNTERARIGG